MKKDNNKKLNIENINKAIKELNLEVYGSGETIIYKYVSFDTLKKILIGNTLFFNTANSFNDPFDLYVDLIDFTYYKNYFKTVLDDNKIAPHLRRSERRRLILMANRDNTKRKVIPVFKEEFEKNKNTFGICCFSKSPNKTLMWSHYANNHNGACLGFKFDLPKDFYILSVKYVPNVNPINYFLFKAKALLNCLFTKSKIWEYEEEVRAVNFAKNGLIPFNKESLREIYFGLRTSEDDLNKINTLLNENGYSVFMKKKMIINPKTFDLKAVDLIL